MASRWLKIIMLVLAVNVLLNVLAILIQNSNTQTKGSDRVESPSYLTSPENQPYIVPKLHSQKVDNVTVDALQVNTTTFQRHHWSDSFLPNEGIIFPEWESLIPQNYNFTADFVLGIPTISRKGVSYLHQTLSSLVSNLGEDHNVVIVVYIGEEDEGVAKGISDEVEDKFQTEIASGLVKVVIPPDNFYPNWTEQLRESFSDPFLRNKWRSKQNLDQIFLMMYAYFLRPKYYLMLEDDIIATNGYLNKISQDAEGRKDENFILISYCQLGAIGKLFRRSIIPSIANFLALFWADKPLDWLLLDYGKTRTCTLEEDAKTCGEKLRQVQIVYKPSLFQHIGTLSSLAGKKQNLKDKSFKPS